jgi:hypothetical protein
VEKLNGGNELYSSRTRGVIHSRLGYNRCASSDARRKCPSYGDIFSDAYSGDWCRGVFIVSDVSVGEGESKEWSDSTGLVRVRLRFGGDFERVKSGVEVALLFSPAS